MLEFGAAAAGAAAAAAADRLIAKNLFYMHCSRLQACHDGDRKLLPISIGNGPEEFRSKKRTPIS
jgi:hypothetical protein